MENDKAKNLARGLEIVLVYAGQLSHVLHRYRLTLEIDSIVPIAVEEHISLVSSAIGTLNGVLTLLRNKAGTDQIPLFSEEGHRYVNVLVLEYSEILQKIAPITAKACLKRERKKKQKNAKKVKAEVVIPVVPKQLKLDDEKFSNDLENAIWYRVCDVTDAYMERLKEIQLHLLLIYQVVTVGSFSRDLSSGKFDIQKIVSYHERINRTADLIGISPGSRHHRFRPSSSSIYTLSESDSDSDVSSSVSRRRSSRSSPPPPPPGDRGPLPEFQDSPAGNLAYESNIGYPHSPTSPPSPGTDMTRPLIQAPVCSQGAIDVNTSNVNPPSYDSHRGLNIAPLKQTSSFQNLQTCPIFPNEKGQDSKENSTTKLGELYVVKKPLESRVSEGQLFSSPHNHLSFKIKSLFRSKDSLATEMKKVLEKYFKRTRSISYSSTTSSTMLFIPTGPKNLRREIVALKVLQENKKNAWMRLLAGKLHTPALPQHYNHRLILAILREPLVDGERKLWVAHGIIPVPDLGRVSRPPPPSQIEAKEPSAHPLQPPAMLPNIRSPPTTADPNSLSGPRLIGLDDSRSPAPNVGGCVNPKTQGTYLPPVSQPRGPPPAFGQASSPSDRAIWTDAEASVALITYNEYTLRIAGIQPNQCRTWSSIILTQESNILPEVLARVNSFIGRGNTIIDAKLRLTDQQSTHMTRLLEEIQGKERDHRFEWCWVEVSLYDSIGQIAICSPGDSARTATTMHLIAKRSLKREYKPADVYHNLLMRGPALAMPPSSPQSPSPLRSDPPPPLPGPPPPPTRAPPFAPTPCFLGRSRPRPRGNWRTRCVSISDLDSLSGSGSDSNSSYGSRREEARRRRRNNRRVRHRHHDSESSDDSDDDEDIIKIPVVLKRGDDVVKKLLDLWTLDGSECKRD
ncbi:hypothetical protein DID88_005970 [Monilinia fructigena]|uniref:Uncharacterized protein n=1 Tax=Monilinia fructigena TaxID=38457 RepID=A0A395J1E2_9HELO|nr:hypothetical protein DID88_005970 [Monilinia fructigena]